MKVDELIGEHLDLFVTRANAGRNPSWDGLKPLPFSTNWGLAGLIIEREQIAIAAWVGDDDDKVVEWRAEVRMDGAGYFTSLDLVHRGPTPLVAAMRAFVYEKFGEEVDYWPSGG